MQFLYLIQGSKSRVIHKIKTDLDGKKYICLTWDEPIRDNRIQSIFLPNSSWAQGRNALILAAKLSQINFDYIVILDDDYEFLKGDFAQLEKYVSIFQPKIAVPLTEEIQATNRYVKNLSVQKCLGMDQIIQIFHVSVIHEEIAIPYVTEFDTLSWWAACELNNHLSIVTYGDKCLQFNQIIVLNTNHSRGKVPGSTYLEGMTSQMQKSLHKYLSEKKDYLPAPYDFTSQFHDSKLLTALKSFLFSKENRTSNSRLFRLTYFILNLISYRKTSIQSCHTFFWKRRVRKLSSLTTKNFIGVKNISLISFSKRGGGARFAIDLIHENPKIKNLFLSKKVQSDFCGENILINQVKVPHSKFSFAWLSLPQTLSTIIRLSKNSDLVIFTMPHPLDPLLIILYKLLNVPTAIVIHDNKAHTGENWPPARSIRYRVRACDLTFSLSSFVQASIFSDYGVQSIRINFPVHSKIVKPHEEYILFTGRMKEYQGLRAILKYWRYHWDDHQGLNLRISGSFPEKIMGLKIPNLICESGWLDDYDLDQLIQKAAALILPYSEATQSGLFYQAMDHGVPVVTTAVGGLLEQAEMYTNAILISDDSPASIKFGVDLALQSERNNVRTKMFPSITEFFS